MFLTAAVKGFIKQFMVAKLQSADPGGRWSKASVFGRSLAGIVGSNPAGGMDVCLVSVVCCQVAVFASG